LCEPSQEETNNKEREGGAEGNEDLGRMEKYTLKVVEKWDTNWV
jgi:hypothetical protein